MTFAENIKKYRTASNLTQEELAEKVGVSGQAVSKWETSDTFPDPSLLPALADVLGVSIDMLFGHETRTWAAASPAILGYIQDGETDTKDDRMYDLLQTVFRAADIYPKERANTEFAEEWLKSREDSKWVRTEVFNNRAAGYMFRHPEFTYASMVFEPEGGFETLFTESALAHLEALGDPDTMKCVMALLRRADDRPSSFELGVLLRDAGVDPSREDHVYEKMKHLYRMVFLSEVEINGKARRIVKYHWNYTVYLLNIIAGACAASANIDSMRGGTEWAKRRKAIFKSTEE